MNTVKDIINHALELLDYDDSKVVGYKEMNNYLDKAWRHVNQTLINNGVHYFYKKMEVTVGANPLPWNFGQMSCIRTRYGTLLQRRTADLPDNYPSYDIIGNTLYIYGKGYSDYLTMEYWEKPLTLTYPNTKQDITDNFTLPDADTRYYKTYDVYMYDTGSVSTSGLKINNWATGETVEYEFPALALNFWVNKQIVVHCSNNVLYFLNYKGELIGNRSITNPQNIYTLLYKDELYIADGATPTQEEGYYHYSFENCYGKVIEFVLNRDVNENYAKFIKMSDRIFYVADSGAIIDIKNTTSEPDVELAWDETVYGTTTFEDQDTIVTNKRMIWWFDDVMFEEPIDFEENFIAYVKLDWKDGYGALTTDGTNYYLESFVPDTALDFPNTLMYDYLSYLIALSIAKKIGLQFNGDDAEKIFIDSLDNSGDYKQLRNVYQY